MEHWRINISRRWVIKRCKHSVANAVPRSEFRESGVRDGGDVVD
jgi:hypothetical protein